MDSTHHGQVLVVREVRQLIVLEDRHSPDGVVTLALARQVASMAVDAMAGVEYDGQAEGRVGPAQVAAAAEAHSLRVMES